MGVIIFQKKFSKLVLLCSLLVFVVGCGVKNAPSRVKESTYPRHYPFKNDQLKKNIVIEQQNKGEYEYPNLPKRK